MRAVVARAALLLGTARAALVCTSDRDCSFTGVCTVARECACDPGWRGDDCGVLDLAPATRGTGYNRTAEGTSSWGGRIVPDPADANLFHLFAAEFTGGCGLDFWSPMSRIIRAESRTGAEGPYVFASEVVGTFAHNPTVIRDPTRKQWLMYHIGCAVPQPSTCTQPSFSCDGGDAINGESGVTLRVSKDLRTWSEVGRVLTNNTDGLWDTDTTNPSAWLQPNGSVVLFYRGCPYNCGGDELLNCATGPAPEGPFARAGPAPIFGAPAEDPFVWSDRRGHWHVLMHSLEPDGGCVQCAARRKERGTNGEGGAGCGRAVIRLPGSLRMGV